MNMKKTIAAVAAGSVAVSAMAATAMTASAEKVLSYSLVREVGDSNNSKATLTATVPNVNLPKDTTVRVTVNGATFNTINATQPLDNNGGTNWNNDGDTVIVAGSYYSNAGDANKSIIPIKATTDQGDADFTKEGYGILHPVNASNPETNGAGMYLDIPVYAEGQVATTNGASLVESTSANLSVTVKYKHLAKWWGTTAITGPMTWGADTWTVQIDVPQHQEDTEEEAAEVTARIMGSTKSAALDEKLEYALDVTQFTGNAGDRYDYDGTSWSLNGTVMTAQPTTTSGVTTIDGIKLTIYGSETAASGTTIIIDKKYVAAGNKTVAAWTSGKVGGNVTFDAGTIKTIPMATDAGGVVEFTQGNYDTSKQHGNGVVTDVITFLEKTPCNPTGTKNKVVNGSMGSYDNVTAVLNDAIANFTGGVTFKFTSAADVWYNTDRNGNLVYSSVRTDNPYNDNYYHMSGSKFGSHTYTNWFNWESQGDHTGFAWGGQNLFAGALIINERLTMSLSDVDYFDWGENSISFSWDAIVDSSITNNDLATYLGSMDLATSSIWFWNSLDVICEEGVADDAAADAGIEGDSDTLDDDEGDDDIGMDDDEPADDGDDDEPVDVTPDPEPEPEPVVVAPTNNPTTGNASVALAVIPVALAAAAVVAKKRG